MNVTMIRAKVKEESVAEVEAAAEKVFAALDRDKPAGVRYASSKLEDGVTFVILIGLATEENPLQQVPEVQAFTQSLPGWLAGPPVPETLTVVGSYNLF